MPSFASNATITLSLDADDIVSFSGDARYTLNPTAGSQSTSTTTGQQTFGPYKQYVTLVFVTTTAGSYTQSSDVSANAVARLFTDASGNSVGVTSPTGASYSSFGLANATDANTRFVKRMKGRVLSGSGRGRILPIGDSTTASAGAATGTTGCVGAFAKSYPTQLAAALTAKGLRASNKSFGGDQSIGSQVTYPQYDPRATPAPGVGWSFTLNSLGGNAAYFQGGGAGVLSLTEVCTNFTVYHARGFSSGTATVSVDGGGSLGTLSAIGGSDVIGTTFSAGALGSHIIQINASNNGNFVIVAIVAWDATNTGIDIVQAGAFGVASSFFTAAANPWNALNAIGYLTPDLTVIQLGINDIIGSVSPATYGQNLSTIAAAAKVSGDVLIMDMLPMSAYPFASQQPYINAAIAAANSNGCMFASVNNRFSNSYTTSNTLGYYYDTLHLLSPGYGMEADWLAGLILSI